MTDHRQAVLHLIQKNLSPDALFFISKTTDMNVVVYMARHHNAVLHEREPLAITTCDVADGATDTGELTQCLVDNFFGIASCKKLKDRLYRCGIKAMPDRPVLIAFGKKTRKPKAVTTINDVPACDLICVEIDMSFNSVGIPTLNSLTLHGKKQAQVIKEKLEITPDMMARFNVAAIARQYFSSKTKSK